jgi:hypothetical protein
VLALFPKKNAFYLPQMEYEGNIGFGKNVILVFAYSHVSGHFMAKKAWFGRNKDFRLPRAVDGVNVTQNLGQAYSLPLKS